MKILYATRLFSGLESSFTNGTWSPTGVPTIYKIIEELDKYDTRFIFSVKDSGNGYCSLWGNEKDCISQVDGLNHSVKILSGISFFPAVITRKLAMILRDIRQSIIIIIEAIRFNPDVVYCDHANIIVAAVISRFQRKIPVVFRAMGIYPFMRDALDGSKLIHKTYKWAYRSPFALVICTQDGSGVEQWLYRAIRNEVPKKILLNGVDRIILPENIDNKLESVSKKKNVILFVGKLEKYKGCYEFVESIIYLLDKKVLVHALIIGTGSEIDQLKNIVQRSKYKRNFIFIDRLPHEQIMAAHKMSEIYVSMNHFGNLSNANLEAIQSNDCIIIPYPQLKTGVDVITDNLLKGTVVNAPIDNPKYLSNVLYDLIKSKKERLKVSEKIRIRKRDFLYLWDERISIEMDILKNLAKVKI